MKEQAEKAKQEQEDVARFDSIKADIRNEYDKVKKAIEEVERYGRDKKVRQTAQALSLSALDVLGETYQSAAAAIEGKDKYKQNLTEGSTLAAMLQKEVNLLTEAVNKANKENSFMGRIKKTIDEILSEG